MDTPSPRPHDSPGHPSASASTQNVYDRPLPAIDVRAWLAAIGEIGHEANATTSIAAHISRIAEQCCLLLGYDFCAILLAEPTGMRLIVEGAHGLAPEFVERYNRERPVAIGPQPLGEGPSSRAFRSGLPVAVPDVAQEPLFGPWGDVPSLAAPYQAMLSVPLMTRNGAIGVINCYAATVREFADEEIRLVEILADQAAISLEAAALRVRERETIADLERQRHLLERSEAIHRNLTRVVLKSEGLPGIARALARLLGAPVSIEDASGQSLASSVPRGVAVALAAGTPGAPAAVLARLAASDGQVQVVEMTPNGGDPGESALAGGFWVASVTVGDEMVGRVWVGPIEGAPGSIELRALEHGTTVVALEMLKQRATQEVEWRVRGDLLGDLLAERIEDEAALRARARRLGHDLSGILEVITVRPTHSAALSPERPATPAPAEPGVVQALLDLVSRSTDGIVSGKTASRPLVARYRDQIVVLCAAVDQQGRRLAPALAQQILAGALRLGQPALIAIGPPAEQLGELAGSVRMALGALNLAERTGRRDVILTLDQLDVYGLILQIERTEALERFASKLLDPLDDYDRQRGAELQKTLRVYLEHRMSIADAAAALIVHPHTLRYRLSRIEALLGLSLREPEGLLRLRFAMMIRDIVAP